MIPSCGRLVQHAYRSGRTVAVMASGTRADWRSRGDVIFQPAAGDIPGNAQRFMRGGRRLMSMTVSPVAFATAS